MVLGISEDFSSDVVFDAELTSIPQSGIFVNTGVHPSVNVKNLLEFLPNLGFTFSTWSAATTYGKFLETRGKKDIVFYNSKIYQSISSANINNLPTESNSEYWLETNMESLRLKMFMEKVKDRVYSDLSLTKQLINNQYIYDNGASKTKKTVPNDYFGWVLEPKGSDYVNIKVNQMSIEKDGTTPVNVYVINQKELIKTITLTPNNGKLVFEDVDVTFSGKGSFKLVLEATETYVGQATIDPFKYDGFTAYTTLGDGDAPETANYTYNTFGQGVGLNLTVYLDSKGYIDNNLSYIANYIRTTFELMAFEMFLYNSNARSNRTERMVLDTALLMAETKDMKNETIIRRYHRERKKAMQVIEKTFDTQLSNGESYEISIGTL